jgi:hypothetical protein
MLRAPAHAVIRQTTAVDVVPLDYEFDDGGERQVDNRPAWMTQAVAQPAAVYQVFHNGVPATAGGAPSYANVAAAAAHVPDVMRAPHGPTCTRCGQAHLTNNCPQLNTLQCFKCGDAHLTFMCPLRMEVRHAVCTNCGIMGHLAAACQRGVFNPSRGAGAGAGAGRGSYQGAGVGAGRGSYQGRGAGGGRGPYQGRGAGAGRGPFQGRGVTTVADRTYGTYARPPGGAGNGSFQARGNGAGRGADAGRGGGGRGGFGRGGQAGPRDF